jgi:hypothetical protein
MKDQEGRLFTAEKLLGRWALIDFGSLDQPNDVKTINAICRCWSSPPGNLISYRAARACRAARQARVTVSLASWAREVCLACLPSGNCAWFVPPLACRAAESAQERTGVAITPVYLSLNAKTDK